MRRAIAATGIVLASLGAGSAAYATVPDPDPVIEVDDDDDSDKTGLWGLLGLAGLAGLLGLKRRDDHTYSQRPVTGAAPRDSHGATGTKP